MKWVIFWSLISLGGAEGLAKENEKIEIYYPLSVGNKWIYRIKIDTTVTDSIIIIDTLRWNGIKCYKQRWFTMANETGYKYHLYCNGELREYNEIPSDTASYAILLKEPFEIGKTWEFVLGDTFLYKIEDENVDIELLGKTFHDCLKVSRKILTEPLGNAIFWFAPNIGMIKCTFPEVDANIQLLGYKID